MPQRLEPTFLAPVEERLDTGTPNVGFGLSDTARLSGHTSGAATGMLADR